MDKQILGIKTASFYSMAACTGSQFGLEYLSQFATSICAYFLVRLWVIQLQDFSNPKRKFHGRKSVFMLPRTSAAENTYFRMEVLC